MALKRRIELTRGVQTAGLRFSSRLPLGKALLPLPQIPFSSAAAPDTVADWRRWDDWAEGETPPLAENHVLLKPISLAWPLWQSSPPRAPTSRIHPLWPKSRWPICSGFSSQRDQPRWKFAAPLAQYFPFLLNLPPDPFCI